MANFQIIRRLLSEKNITLRDLAENVGVTESTMYALMKKGSTSTITLEAIAKYLNVPASIFFDDGSGTLSISGNGNTHVSGGVSGDRNQIGSNNTFDGVQVARDLHEENRRLSDLNHKLVEKNMKMADRIVQLTDKLLKNESP